MKILSLIVALALAELCSTKAPQEASIESKLNIKSRVQRPRNLQSTQTHYRYCGAPYGYSGDKNTTYQWIETYTIPASTYYYYNYYTQKTDASSYYYYGSSFYGQYCTPNTTGYTYYTYVSYYYNYYSSYYSYYYTSGYSYYGNYIDDYQHVQSRKDRDKQARIIGVAVGLPVGTLLLVITVIITCCCCLKLKKDPLTGKKTIYCRKSVRSCTCCIKRSKKVQNDLTGSRLSTLVMNTIPNGLPLVIGGQNVYPYPQTVPPQGMILQVRQDGTMSLQNPIQAPLGMQAFYPQPVAISIQSGQALQLSQSQIQPQAHPRLNQQQNVEHQLTPEKPAQNDLRYGFNPQKDNKNADFI